jgi:hypothetical protein
MNATENHKIRIKIREMDNSNLLELCPQYEVIEGKQSMTRRK